MTGQATKYTDKIAETILALAEGGRTDREIADEIGINVSTIRLWRARHPDFAVALKDAKAVADELVELSLFQRATGYRTTVTKVFWDKEKGEVVKASADEVYPPDTTAAIFWLKNRQRERWRDVWHIQHTVEAALPDTAEALKILQEDYATLPAKEVKAEDL